MSATIQEIDYLFLADSTGLSVYGDAEALRNNCREWFRTPQGSVAGWPSWGHTLGQFRFHPQSAYLATMIESVLIRKMPVDIYGLAIKGIFVSFLAIDLCHVKINIGVGVFEDTVRL